MFRKMLKHTTVFFMLMAFFMVSASVLFDGTSTASQSPQPVYGAWGTPVADKKCRGKFTEDGCPDCDDIEIADCATTSAVYTIVEESTCDAKGYGTLCWERTVSWPVSTVGCKVLKRAVKDSDGKLVWKEFCMMDNTNVTTNYEDFTDCKDNS